ncbi:MAG TPA: acetylornithine deacetylase [Polyangiaceae bacterium]|jgi:acetylornithine deacetylase|nr:MAG: Acetylornithine deacetylase [Deltaproteobacteria bacterium ADurb.Bin207]HNS97919.1 acetylornithine deacetylase [Polyangiaceae bacterium]HNZ21734.1 acetylornithine deacetylase [Polyangiaceae bacterium]HOD21599.1 acetylornithine deacetylase [Polyangiaceae bacterium]HOE50571.1 acetylornithine deacetylase [Polyangiaceae bacterium]
MVAPDRTEMMRALVATASASSFDPAKDEGNQGVIDLLASWLSDLGFSIELQTLSGTAASRSNLIARLGDGPGGLVLAGHADTVACEHGRWSFDPYRLTLDHGRYYGLGIADMKVFFAVAIEAAQRFSRHSLREPLYLVATADEECAMLGAHKLVEAGKPRARWAVLGEPTSLEPVRMHKGMMMTRVRLTGKSGHSSDPKGGASALDGMLAVCNAMVAWREELASHRDDNFRVAIPTLNLGTLHGGDHPNRICGQCELQMDLRPLPGMDITRLRTTMRERIEKAIAFHDLQLEIDALYPGTEPLCTRSESPLVQFAELVTEKRATSAGYGTEAPHYARLGMDVVVLGPGDIAQAHQPDEYVQASRLDPMVDILSRIIRRFCVED